MRPGNKAAAAAATAWGFAEATLFFIVPDVLLTFLALKSGMRAFQCALFAALGATIGGLVIWSLANAAPDRTFAVLLMVPGVSNATFETVKSLMDQGIYLGMLTGAFLGVPFKVFAAEAGSADLNPITFAVLSPAARLPRFLALSALAWALSCLVGSRLSVRSKLAVTVVIWAAFYFFYFKAVGW